MNVFDYFFENSHAFEKKFLLGRSEQISFRELHARAQQLSRDLVETTEPDARIIILSPNNVFFLVAYLAILKSGRICVPLNPDIEKSNLEYILSACKSKTLFVEARILEKYELTDYRVISSIEEKSLPSAIEFHPGPDFDSSRCAEIIFTSGSTGVPKGVMISHKNLMANTNSIVEYLRLSSNDIMEVVLPFYYCYGLSLLHTHLRVGGSIVLNNNFIFLGTVLKDLITYKCTGFAGVPSHFQLLLRKSDSFKNEEFPDLRYVTQAGGKLHTAFIEEFVHAHPKIDFVVMYGQTEATARLSYLPVENLLSKTGSIGRGIPGVQLRVVDEDGVELAHGQVGEIVARGENIMLGYLNDEEETEKTIRNGWLYTGDLGKTDHDGFIYLTARKKEIIKVGGQRVSPKEIEAVILTVPEIIACEISAIEDEHLGEAIRADITINTDHANKITPAYIQQFCTKSLAMHKVPGHIKIHHNVAISATGKKVKK